jgi:hypothetical protein
MAPIRSLLPRIVALTLVGTALPLVVAAPASAARAKTVRIADAAIVEGNAGQQNLSFRLTWTGSKGGPAPSVQVATADVSATAGADYTSTTGTATLSNGGCRCTTFNVPIKGDGTTEGTETFVVNLSNVTNGTIGDAQAVGTIYDNEGPPTIVATDVAADEDAGTLSFGVLLTNTSTSTITVSYATSGGTAVAGTDFTSASGGLTFTPGQSSKTISLAMTDDALAEDDETVLLDLSSPTNASIADAQAVGTILNDDADPTASVADVTVDETAGQATFTVSLSGASGRETAVDYATTDANATAGEDYTTTGGTLTIPAGATSGTFDVPVADDAVHEGVETFTVTLSDEVDLTLGDASGTGAIDDDDPVPTLGVGSPTASESAGTATATFTLSNPSATDVTFDWATADGSATADADYTAAGGPLTITAGATSVSGSVPILSDTSDEPGETVTIAVANLVGATDGGAGTLTITDDDPTPTALTAKVATTRTAVKAKGLLEPAAAGLTVKVTLLRKKGTRYVKVTAKVVPVKGLKDRDGDLLTDGAYVASFPRPARGAYRCKVAFLGTADLRRSGKVVSFRV